MKFFKGFLTLIVVVLIFGFGALQNLWFHDLKNKSIDKIKSFISSDEEKPKLDFDLMTKEKCKGINALILMEKNLSFDELKEREKITSFEVVKDIACITLIGNKATGMFLVKDYKVTTVDSRDIEKALNELKSY